MTFSECQNAVDLARTGTSGQGERKMMFVVEDYTMNIYL